MFDCGEAVQRQMICARVGLHNKLKIFITHMHGDHVLGLPGLIQTMSLLNRQIPVEVYGPTGLSEFLECLKEVLQFELTFKLNIHEIINPGIICTEEEYNVEAVHSNHAISSFAFSFLENPRPGKFHPEKARLFGIPQGEAWGRLQLGIDFVRPDGKVVQAREVVEPPRNGRKIVYTGDTRPFPDFARFAKDADYIIHEATFDDDLIEKANLDGHSTPSQAAQQAKDANAKNLVLTHISARYAESHVLLIQAQKIFQNSKIAEDFLELELPLGE